MPQHDNNNGSGKNFKWLIGSLVLLFSFIAPIITVAVIGADVKAKVEQHEKELARIDMLIASQAETNVRLARIEEQIKMLMQKK